LYKLWAQFQQSGKVLTVPFVVDAAAAAPAATAAEIIPEGAIRILVTQHGYQPARLEVPAGKPLTLAITRTSEPNCGSEIVFPSLKIREALPLGRTVLVQLPAQEAGEIAFSCGMGMFRGMIVAR
jgi:plastocyanin domain-containing protein